MSTWSEILWLIRMTAYFKYERRGRQPGRDKEDWYAAEKEVLPNKGKKACILFMSGKGPQIPSNIIPEPIKIGVNEFLLSITNGGIMENYKSDTENRLKSKYDFVDTLFEEDHNYNELIKVLAKHALWGTIIDIISVGHGNADGIFLYNKKRLWNGTAYTKDGKLKSTSGCGWADNISNDVYNLVGIRPILRLVYMTNCKGERLNDDWLKSGAMVSVGTQQQNMMPEPMLQKFLDKWLAGHSAKTAASYSFEEAKKAWFIYNVYPSFYSDSVPKVEGNSGCNFYSN